jgi:protein-disulfide isomerase
MPDSSTTSESKEEESDKGSVFERLTPVLIILVIGLAFIVGVLWQKVSTLSGDKQVVGTDATPEAEQGAPPKLTKEQFQKIPRVTDKDHVRGSRDAQVFVVEYSDLECPYCKMYHPVIQQTTEEFGDSVAWVYRHFNLDQRHPTADKESEAVECAGELGGEQAFWKLLDKIYEETPSNSGLNIEDLPKMASEIGLDQGEFKTCLDSGKFAEKVESDYQGGLGAGVTGTPGSFIFNSKGDAWLVPGLVSKEVLKETIQKAL